MDSMQAEALRRAQEMHSTQRRRNSADTSRKDSQNLSGNQERENHRAPKEEAPSVQKETHNSYQQNDSSSKPDFPVSSLFEDKEKLLIIVLILILISEEKADTYTILALLYLII